MYVVCVIDDPATVVFVACVGVAAFTYVPDIPFACVDVFVDTFATIVLVVVIGLPVVNKVDVNDECVIFVPFAANVAFVAYVDVFVTAIEFLSGTAVVCGVVLLAKEPCRPDVTFCVPGTYAEERRLVKCDEIFVVCVDLFVDTFADVVFTAVFG